MLSEEESRIFKAFATSNSRTDILTLLRDTISQTVILFNACHPAGVKEHMVVPWRVMTSVIETALTLVSLRQYGELLSVLESSLAMLDNAIHDLLRRALDNDDSRKVTSSVNSLYVQLTAVFNGLAARARLTCDEKLCARVLRLAESILPSDSKGGCNLYRKRFADEDIMSDESFAEAAILSNLRDSLISPETVFRSGIAWSKFYTFAKDALSSISASKTGSSVEQIPLAALDKRLTSSGSFSKSVKLRLLAQITFAVAAAQASGDPITDNQAKQVDQLKKIIDDFGKTIGCGEILRAVIETDSVWTSWKSPGAKEACPPYDRFCRIDRGLAPLIKPIPEANALPTYEGSLPKQFVAAMIDTLELPLDFPIDDAPPPSALRRLKKLVLV